MSRRPGVALLLVLVTLAISTTAALVMARKAATAAISRSSSAQLRLGESIALGTRPLVLEWLRSGADSAVVGPDRRAPSIAICRDAFATPLGTATVQVTAFDQLGMIPWDRAGDVRATGVPELPPVPEHEGPFGLDVLGGVAVGPVFPGHTPVETVTRYGAVIPEEKLGGAALGPDGPVALGAVYASHATDPDARRRTPADWAVNVNTAPMWLVDEVFRRAGIEPAESFREARAAGEHASPPIRSVGAGESTIRLVASSGRWAFRTDVEVGGVRHATWTMYVRRGREWRLEQSLVIAD